jgi:hypothetical protein
MAGDGHKCAGRFSETKGETRRNFRSWPPFEAGLEGHPGQIQGAFFKCGSGGAGKSLEDLGGHSFLKGKGDENGAQGGERQSSSRVVFYRNR